MERVENPHRPARTSRATVAGRAVAVLVLGSAILSGCGSSSGATSSTPTGTSPATTPTATRQPLEQCTDQLEYWAEKMLADFDNPGFDYQHMGLTATKYDVLRELVREARTAEAAGTLAATWVHDEIVTACSRILAEAPATSDAVGWP